MLLCPFLTPADLRCPRPQTSHGLADAPRFRGTVHPAVAASACSFTESDSGTALLLYCGEMGLGGGVSQSSFNVQTEFIAWDHYTFTPTLAGLGVQRKEVGFCAQTNVSMSC